jgi:hypothetical protein
VAAVAGVGAVVLYSVPPTADSFYPICLFHALTGLHCPGCGSTRCLHALLHGDMWQASRYNLLLLLLLPLLAAWGLQALWITGTPGPKSARRLPAWSLHLLLGIIVAFWILRNIDYPLFHWLAPNRLP